MVNPKYCLKYFLKVLSVIVFSFSLGTKSGPKSVFRKSVGLTVCSASNLSNVAPLGSILPSGFFILTTSV